MTPPDPFDPDALRAPAQDFAALRNRTPQRPPRHRPGEPFLGGPVPWQWVLRAAALPGKALIVGLWLWREAGCSKVRSLRFSSAWAADLGCHPDALRRGLRQLELAGLIAVERPAGRCPVVTLLDVRPPDGPCPVTVQPAERG